MAPETLWCKPGDELPEVSTPFVVLIDADDAAWRRSSFVEQACQDLVEHGCRVFVCAGHRSEDIHDQLDGCLESRNLLDLPTTFHSDECPDDTVNFAMVYAATKTYKVLFLVQRQVFWGAHLANFYQQRN